MENCVTKCEQDYYQKLYAKKHKKEKQIRVKNVNVVNLSPTDYPVLCWVKTILNCQKFLPNIISLVDKLVTSKAINPNCSYIFDDAKNGTLGQMQEIIDIADRKLSLINLYNMAQDLINSLPQKYKAFAKDKFVYAKKTEYLAQEYGVDSRTIARWSNGVLASLLNYCKQNNWSSEFIELQVEREGWIFDHYQKNYNALIKNIQKSKNMQDKQNCI